ncbi:hypothetical protein [Nocardia sp. NPDC059229]|uniref:hypothetical protein n=1 Tax=Nocardia sp. NPDC059229 TaxID=3346778 RepID=UPI0036974E39
MNHLGSDPRQASIAAILGAQAKLIAESRGRLKLIPASGHMTVPSVGVMPTQAQSNAEIDSRAQDLDVIIGTTAQEMTAFHRQVPWMQRLRAIPGIGPALANAIEQTIGALMFGIPSFVKSSCRCGGASYVRSPDGGRGAARWCRVRGPAGGAVRGPRPNSESRAAAGARGAIAGHHDSRMCRTLGNRDGTTPAGGAGDPATGDGRIRADAW